MLGQVRRVPVLPAWHLRLERRVPRRDPFRVDTCDLGPLPGLECGDRDARHLDRHQQQPALAAGWITGSPVLGLARLHRLDDRAVHPVCDLVRELDAHLLEARRLEPRLVLALVSAPAMQPT